MSTIRVDNFAPSAGGTAFSQRGIARSHWHFDQVTLTTSEALNTSSVTDVSVGVVRGNPANPFSRTAPVGAATAIVSGTSFASTSGPSNVSGGTEFAIVRSTGNAQAGVSIDGQIAAIVWGNLA